MPILTFPRGKTTPPEQGSGLISRDRLSHLFQQGARQSRLTLVVAPAGYGKTIALTAFYHHIQNMGQAAYWYNCDRADVVPQRLLDFLREIAAVDAQLRSDGNPGLDTGMITAANVIVAQLERHRRHVTIILENYHLAQSPATDTLIEALLNSGSPFLHLILSSRVRPTISTRKLALTGQVAEFRVRDLAFTQSELAALVSAAMPSLNHLDLSDFWRKTEGWPVAVRLLLVALQEGADKARLLGAIAERDTDIAEYLSEEVLRGQPRDLRDFLLTTCFVEQFSAPLYEALQPGTNGADIIDRAERNNLFLSRVEPGSEWLRYHPIFRQCLLTQFARLSRERRSALRSAAGIWFAREGFIAEAVDMALQNGAIEQARDLLSGLAPELVSMKGDLATFLHLLDRMPEDIVAADPRLRYWQAWAMFFSRRYRQAARLVARLHSDARLAPPGTVDKGLQRKIGLLDTLAATFTDDMNSARREGTEWLNDIDNAGSFDRATVACALVLAHLAYHDLAAARRTFEIAQRAIADSRSIYGIAWVCGVGMTLDLIAGEPQSALARYQALEDDWAAAGQTPTNISSTLVLLASAANYHLGQIDEARRLGQGGLTMLADHGVSETATFALGAGLRLAAMQQGTAEALTLSRKIEGMLVKAYAPRLELALRYERALMLFRSNRIDDAIAEAASIVEVQPLGEPNPGAADGELPCARELRQIIAIRVALAERTWSEALRLLSRLIGSARHGGRHLRLVHALILKAGVHYGQSDNERAVRTLFEAVEIARQRGLVQIFLDDHLISRPLVALALNTHARRDPLQAFLAALQTPLGLDHSEEHEADISAPLEPLTSREQLMAEYLHRGMRNREIAGQLSMSEATVKWHLYNLYNKLGVNNRTAAIHRARMLGLVGT